MYFVDIVMEREIDYELTIATHSPHYNFLPVK